MNRFRPWFVLLIILAIASYLRLTGLDWDEYHHYHPDERYITWVATTIEWPASGRGALDPQKSSFNPFYWPANAASDGIEVLQDEQRDFAYGHLPLYLGVGATRFVEWAAPVLLRFSPSPGTLTSDLLNAQAAIEFRHLTAVARGLTGLVDVGSILVLYLIGRRLFSAATGLLAAALLAVNVMHIQLSHFFTVDPYLSFFVLASLYFMVRSLQPRLKNDSDPAESDGLQNISRSETLNLFLAAIFIGFAVGSKFSAIMLAAPLVLATWFSTAGRRWRRLAGAAAIGLATFAITNPFALLDLSCEPASSRLMLIPQTLQAPFLRSCYLQNVVTQGAMVRGTIDLGFTRQYAGTLPYLYFMEMQVRWGMGWLLGAAGFAAFAWALWKGARLAWRALKSGGLQSAANVAYRDKGLLILLAWSLPFFLVTGSFYVKFMRYLMPLTPILMLFVAAMVMQWRWRSGRIVLAACLLATSALYAFSFSQMYRSPHPWVAASRWIYEHVPPGSLIASEQWDDSLPSTMLLDNQVRRRSEYEDQQLTWLTYPDEKDDLDRLDKNLNLLQEADYVTVVSNRVYGVVPRSGDRFPLSGQYHQLLFEGALGYEPVFVDTRTPNLFGLNLRPDNFAWPQLTPPLEVAAYLATHKGISGGRFDESFTVYDQPLVMVFENAGRLSSEQMRSQFDTE